MSNELRAVMEFCLDNAQSAAVGKRISLYRGLAEFCGEPKMAAEFCSMATDLEASEQRFQEFAFQFNQRGAK